MQNTISALNLALIGTHYHKESQTGLAQLDRRRTPVLATGVRFRGAGLFCSDDTAAPHPILHSSAPYRCVCVYVCDGRYNSGLWRRYWVTA